jgi:acyl-CoA reductase-like NAD-dependent aldehyde dehydrogenase
MGTIRDGVPADIDTAVAAARRAFDESGWATSERSERAAAMNRLADAMEKRSADIARTVTQQNGMPITLSEQMEGMFAAAIIRYYAGLAEQVVDEVRPSPMGFDTIIQHSPVGVVAAITPWNFPQVLGAMKIGPALASGCTMVLKPAPGTTLDSYLLAEAAHEAELPPGVLNWVAGERELGAYLVKHPDVDKVAFTGSTAAGRAIGAECGALLRPVTLELGGKSAAIILDDADLEAAMGDCSSRRLPTTAKPASSAAGSWPPKVATTKSLPR